jgi:hypothetical protein
LLNIFDLFQAEQSSTTTTDPTLFAESQRSSKTIKTATTNVATTIVPFQNDLKSKVVKKAKKSKKTTKFQKLRMAKEVDFLGSVECSDKECVLEHKLMQNCIIYLHSNNTNCKIPCDLSGCRTEMHHFMNCPIWQCTFYPNTSTTTTTTTSIPDFTTTNGPNPFPPQSHDSILYSSLLINVIFVLGLLFLAFQKLKKWHRSRNARISVQRRSPVLENDHPYFSVATEDSNSDSNESPTANQQSGEVVGEFVQILTNDRNVPILQNSLTSEPDLFENVRLNTPPVKSYIEFKNRPFMVMKDYRDYSTFKPNVSQKETTVSNETDETQF